MQQIEFRAAERVPSFTAHHQLLFLFLFVERDCGERREAYDLLNGPLRIESHISWNLHCVANPWTRDEEGRSMCVVIGPFSFRARKSAVDFRWVWGSRPKQLPFEHFHYHRCGVCVQERLARNMIATLFFFIIILFLTARVFNWVC